MYLKYRPIANSYCAGRLFPARHAYAFVLALAGIFPGEPSSGGARFMHNFASGVVLFSAG